MNSCRYVLTILFVCIVLSTCAKKKTVVWEGQFADVLTYESPKEDFKVNNYYIVSYAPCEENKSSRVLYKFVLAKGNEQFGLIYLKKWLKSKYILCTEYFRNSEFGSGNAFFLLENGYGHLAMYQERPSYFYLQYKIIKQLLHKEGLHYVHVISPDDTVVVYFHGNGTWSPDFHTGIKETIILPSYITIEQNLRIFLKNDGSWRFIFPDDTLQADISDSIVTVTNIPDPEVVPYGRAQIKPQPIKIPVPKYPENARKAGKEGDVVVRALVGMDGRIEVASILRSSGNEYLDLAALECALEATFTPAKQRGKIVRVWVSIPVRFKLTG